MLRKLASISVLVIMYHVPMAGKLEFNKNQGYSYPYPYYSNITWILYTDIKISIYVGIAELIFEQYYFLGTKA